MSFHHHRRKGALIFVGNVEKYALHSYGIIKNPFSVVFHIVDKAAIFRLYWCMF